MTKNKVSRVNLFLIELTIVIIFFIIISIIILKVFTQANEISIKTTALNCAVIKAQSNAEKYISSLNNNNIKSETLYMYYDMNWNEASKDNAYYLISLDVKTDMDSYGTMVYLHQEVQHLKYKFDEIIFSLDSQKYISK